jgi:predicted enzyme related to lactoylglutathione lyase
MVDSIAATLEAVIAGGGEVAQPIGADAPEITARFRDPSGNVLGLFNSLRNRRNHRRCRLKSQSAALGP